MILQLACICRVTKHNAKSYSGVTNGWQWHRAYSFSSDQLNNCELSWTNYGPCYTRRRTFMSFTDITLKSVSEYWNLKEMELVGV